MEIKSMEQNFTVCKLKDFLSIDLSKEFYFIGKTDEENSLVCLTENVPNNVIERDDGWKAFRIQGVLPIADASDLSGTV